MQEYCKLWKQSSLGRWWVRGEWWRGGTQCNPSPWRCPTSIRAEQWQAGVYVWWVNHSLVTSQVVTFCHPLNCLQPGSIFLISTNCWFSCNALNHKSSKVKLAANNKVLVGALTHDMDTSLHTSTFHSFPPTPPQGEPIRNLRNIGHLLAEYLHSC